MALDILFPVKSNSAHFRNIIYYGMKYLEVSDAHPDGKYTSQAPKIKSLAASYYGGVYKKNSLEEHKRIGEEIESIHFDVFSPNLLFKLLDGSPSHTDSSHVLQAYLTLHSFSYNVMSLVVSNYSKAHFDFGPLERKVSPPLEAYEYTGVSKLDITPTHRSYGLLFE